MRQTIEKAKQWMTQQWKRLVSPDNRWLTRPVAAAALLVLLVVVKSCQGIVLYHSAEGRLCRAGYPAKEAHTLASQLNATQIDSLITLHGYDTTAYHLVSDRYFIAENFDRYLAHHKRDTASTASDIIAMVNVGADHLWQDSVPCDTSKGILMLINRSHYLNEHYKDSTMVDFEKHYAFGKNMAVKTVVEAFYKMRKDCIQQTNAHLMVSSSYRSYSEQQDTHKQYKKSLVAQAGYSEHQTGLSLDIVSLEHLEKWAFGKSEEGIWVRENCHLYGFILRYPEGKAHITGYDYEPWHLRYVGVEAAKRIHDEGITLDEYYAYYLDRETK
ncbi:MAG: M15 family metallopeptidase [Muribaculaceae bacterium]|nr:M15 family metallopeptidase [Muribaculaceae bacterium]